MCSAHNREILRGRFWFGCYCTCRLPRGGKVPWEGFTPHTLSAHLLLLESPRRFCHQCSADLASFTHCSLLNCNLSSLDPAFVFVSLLSQISSADFEKCHLQPIFRPAYKTPQTLPPSSPLYRCSHHLLPPSPPSSTSPRSPPPPPSSLLNHHQTFRMSTPAISQLLVEVFERLDYWDDGFVDGSVNIHMNIFIAAKDMYAF